ncbi:UDP-N-acetyl-D-mannosamine dehydrogenase [bacterium]|nr:UDP-N-acetyl-D-mannosamine dehydrogenase [bacterium]
MPKKKREICILGLGYIGLPTASIIASRHMHVTGVDTNPKVVEQVSKGKPHIVEPELEGLVYKVVSEKRLTPVTKPVAADIYMITVPTPITDDNKPDVTFVEAAADSIAKLLTKGNLIILESTCPVGTTALISRRLAAKRKDLRFPHDAPENPDIHLAYCPERVLPGRILTELVHNDRVVGGLTPKCAALAADFYYTFVRGECHQTSAEAAELVKLTENAYRDVNIAFANELSLICDKLKLNVWEIIGFANRHPRVDILQPGPGVGGHCISVDPWFIVDTVPEQARLIRTAREINNSKPLYVIDRIKEAAKTFKKKPTIAVLGLAFKPNVDDLRESPALHIAEALADAKIGKILAVEPYIDELPAHLAKSGAELTDALSAIDAADIVVSLVNHRQFGPLDHKRITDKITFDFCGLWK